MALIALKSFAGGIPRIPADQLPPNSGQEVQQCDLAYGDLRGLMGNAALTGSKALSGAKSIWTEDGTTFYLWNTEVEAVKSPAINDVYGRLIYSIDNGADIRVLSRKAYGTNPAYCAATAAGVTPIGDKLGSKAPIGAMSVRVVNYETAATPIYMPNNLSVPWIPAIKGLTIEVRAFFEHNGVKYQDKVATLVDADAYYGLFDSGALPCCKVRKCPTYARPVGAFASNESRVLGREFHVIFPSRGTYVAVSGNTPATGAPPESVRMVQVIGFIDGEQVFSIYPEDSAFPSQRGSVGATMEVNRGTVIGDGYQALIECSVSYGVESTIAFVDTYVNVFGEESAPGDPVTVTVNHGQSVELYKTVTQPDGWTPTTTNDYGKITKWCIYGTNTTSQGTTDYYLAVEKIITTNRGVSSNEFAIVAKKPHEYGAKLETIGWLTPPSGATGLCAMSNGILAVFRNTSDDKYENEVWFCEPYRPYAWPSKYVQTFPFQIVGIKPQGNGLLVTTKGQPYFVYGSHPGAMSSTKLQAMQAGISKLSMCDIGSHVVYASHDGLVAVSNTDVNLELSQRFFTREVWRSKYGSNLAYLNLAYHDGFLIGYFTNGAIGFCIRLDEAAGTFTEMTGNYRSHCSSPLTDALYLAGSGTTFYSFAAGSARQAYSWKSKDFIFPAPVNMAEAQIVMDESESGDATIQVYADDALRQTKTMSSTGEFRTPAGFVARKWSVKIGSARKVKEFYLATSMQEIASV